MKRFLLFLSLTLSPHLLHAGPGSLPYYPTDKLWKVITITGTFQGAIFASAPIVIHAVHVSSPDINVTPSQFYIMASTRPGWHSAISTLTYDITNIDVNVTSATVVKYDFNPNVYDVYSDSWTYATKVGAATVQVFWDWLGLGVGIRNITHPKSKFPASPSYQP